MLKDTGSIMKNVLVKSLALLICIAISAPPFLFAGSCTVKKNTCCCSNVETGENNCCGMDPDSSAETDDIAAKDCCRIIPDPSTQLPAVSCPNFSIHYTVAAHVITSEFFRFSTVPQVIAPRIQSFSPEQHLQSEIRLLI